ncbi:MAG: hypothetical protein BGO43_05370 [Gammaproteobacteria bacterium 39-13]|nr:SDR family NAD(P)-dependent oxidoreductase [Gammaproteobacteria bacterium]OJV96269.1 MAG: hypothetical protein BGO43_05370 [Gammaproteobacteria bacterium 39-13]
MSDINTALITGANRGIGLEVAKELSKKGFQIFLGVRDIEKAKSALAELPELQQQSEIVMLDVNNEESVKKAAKYIQSKISHLDVLVNNAGILIAAEQPIQETSSQEILTSIQTNTLGPLFVMQAFLELLLKSPFARVINVSSGAGALSNMGHWAPAYSISKAALNAVTCQFAAALKEYQIAVNAVCPGWVRTDMGGKIAPRSVEQGADSIVWLATEAPSNLTGKFIHDRAVIEW